jgi:hypothetical protein
LRSTPFWTVTARISADVKRYFGVTYGLHMQGHETAGSGFYLLIAGFLLGSLFNTEDGGDMFLRHVRGLLADYMALQHRRM